MFKIGNAIDTLMGPEKKACDPEDKGAFALIDAGVSAITKEPLSLNTPLSQVASPKELQASLANLTSLYITGGIAEDIISDKTIGDVISSLDQQKVHFVIERLRKEEQEEIFVKTHDELDSLKDTFS